MAGKGSISAQTLVLVDLDSGKDETLRAPGANPAWSPGGYVLYQTNGRIPGLWALRVSPKTGKAEGEPVPVRNEGSDVSASAGGTLVWMDAAFGSRRLTWRDRGGKKLGDSGIPPSVDIQYVALSPDGTQAAYAATEQFGYLDRRPGAQRSTHPADLRPGSRHCSCLVSHGPGGRLHFGPQRPPRRFCAGGERCREASHGGGFS